MTPPAYAFWLFCNSFFGSTSLHDLSNHTRLLLDDDNVSSAHEGIVAHVDLPVKMIDLMVHTSEHDVIGWLTLEQLVGGNYDFELWSQHVLESLLLAPSPTSQEPPEGICNDDHCSH